MWPFGTDTRWLKSWKACNLKTVESGNSVKTVKRIRQDNARRAGILRVC